MCKIFLCVCICAVLWKKSPWFSSDFQSSLWSKTIYNHWPEWSSYRLYNLVVTLTRQRYTHIYYLLTSGVTQVVNNEIPALLYAGLHFQRTYFCMLIAVWQWEPPTFSDTTKEATLGIIRDCLLVYGCPSLSSVQCLHKWCWNASTEWFLKLLFAKGCQSDKIFTGPCWNENTRQSVMSFLLQGSIYSL